MKKPNKHTEDVLFFNTDPSLIKSYRSLDLPVTSLNASSDKCDPEVKSHERKINSDNIYGVILGVLASLSYSITMTLVNSMPQYDFFVTGVYRTLFFFPISILYLIWFRENIIPKGKVLLLVFRGVAGVLSTYTAFICIQYVPVSESATLLQMSPVFVIILGSLFLKQKCSIFTVVIILLVMLGVVLVANPVRLMSDFQTTEVNKQLIGISMALVTDILFAGVILSLDKLRSVNPALIIAYYGSVSAIVSVIGALALGEFRIPSDKTELLMLCFMGIGYGLGQICVALAAKYESGTVVSMLLVSEVIFCSVLQLFLLQQPINTIEGIGVTLIAINILVLGFQRFIYGLPEASSTRKKFKFLLI